VLDAPHHSRRRLLQAPALVQSHARIISAINTGPADDPVGLKAAIYVAEKFGRRTAAVQAAQPSVGADIDPETGERVIKFKVNIGNAGERGDIAGDADDSDDSPPGSDT
jgi:hypothetical protein